MTRDLLRNEQRAALAPYRLKHEWAFFFTAAWLAATYWLIGPVAVHTDQWRTTHRLQLTTAEEFCRTTEMDREVTPWVKELCPSPRINLEGSN